MRRKYSISTEFKESFLIPLGTTQLKLFLTAYTLFMTWQMVIPSNIFSGKQSLKLDSGNHIAAFSCVKSAIETQAQCVKSVQS